MSGMCHKGDSLYVGRKSDDSVRLLQFLPGTLDGGFIPDINTDYPEAVLDRTFLPSEWLDLALSCHPQEDQLALQKVLEAVFLDQPLTEELVENYNRGEDG